MTATMRPEPAIIEEFVWKPAAELGAPVFAFGAAWFPILEDGLRLKVVDRLGAGGRPYGRQVPSRSVAVMEHDDLIVIAEKHMGSAGPPSRQEALLLRGAMERSPA